ncbi:hypothetical protein AKJ18_04595 [Vibrio xuii]|nr:hypothetical protein AKJ18_04595 [Vibrio xuii]
MLKSISRTLLYLPLVWLAVGIIWLPQGSKPMVAIVLPIVLLYVLTHGFQDIKRNFKSDYWLAGIFLSTVFVGMSYLIHGASSQELRGLLISLVYLSVLPIGFINLHKSQMLIFIASLASFSLSIWFFFIEPTDRGMWPTNPIPLAIHQGVIYLLAAALLLSRFYAQKVWLLVLSMLLSGFSMLLTESRGPILGIVFISLLIVAALIFQQKIRTKHALIMLLATCSILFIAREPITSRIGDTSAEVERIQNGDLNSSIGLRIQMYLAGFDLFLQKPIFGHGEISPEYAEKYAPGYSKAAYGFMKGHFHNNYIDKLVKSGAVGTIILMFLLIYPLYLGASRHRDYFWFLVLPAIHYMVMSLFDSPFRNGDTTVLYLIVVGIIIHVMSSNTEVSQSDS